MKDWIVYCKRKCGKKETFQIRFLLSLSKEIIYMKRIIAVTTTLLLCLAAFADDYRPTSTWPYLYPDFCDGDIYTTKGHKLPQKVNIHCAHGKLHFLDNEVIKEVSPADVLMVIIGQDKYIAQYGVMYKVAMEDGTNLVLCSQLGDFSALNETGGAYGTSSTSSATTKLSSFELEGQVNQNHMLILESRQDGVELNIKTTYYLKTPKAFIKATAKEVQSYLGEDRKAEWKAWSKTHKVKWTNPESLLSIFEIL